MQVVDYVVKRISKAAAALLLAALVFLLSPICSEDAFAANFPVTEGTNPTFYESGCLKSLDVSIQASGSYSTAYGKIAIHSGPTSYGWSNRYTYSGTSWPSLTSDPTFIAISQGSEFLWTDCQLHTVTVTFADNAVPGDADKTYKVYLWTRAAAYGVYPDAYLTDLETTTSGEIVFNGEIVTAAEHEFDIEFTIDTPATCTEPGSKSKHCLEDGCTERSEVTTIPALGHDEVAGESVEPTCTETGLTAGTYCATCGIPLEEQEELDALGHDEVAGESVEPTCTETGLTAGTYCATCGIPLEEQEELDALGHDFTGEWTVVREPSATRAGKKETSCLNGCGTTIQDTIPVLGDDEGEDDQAADKNQKDAEAKNSSAQKTGSSASAKAASASRGQDQDVATAKGTLPQTGDRAFTWVLIALVASAALFLGAAFRSKETTRRRA